VSAPGLTFLHNLQKAAQRLRFAGLGSLYSSSLECGWTVPVPGGEAYCNAGRVSSSAASNENWCIYCNW